MSVRYLDWKRSIVVSADDEWHQSSGLCNLQDIGGHIMKIPFVCFQILLFMYLKGTPSSARHFPFWVIFSPLLLLQGIGVLFAVCTLVVKISLLLQTGVIFGSYWSVALNADNCLGFLHHGSRLLGWWSIDEGSREQLARLYCAEASGYNTYAPYTVKIMPKADLLDEIWRLQAALAEQTEITTVSQQEYEQLQNSRILCRVSKDTFAYSRFQQSSCPMQVFASIIVFITALFVGLKKIMHV